MDILLLEKTGILFKFVRLTNSAQASFLLFQVKSIIATSRKFDLQHLLLSAPFRTKQAIQSMQELGYG